MRRTTGVIGLLLILSLAGTACLKTPEIEYVTNKEGQNFLISDNKTDDGGVSIAEQVNIPERAEGTCEKVNAYTTIEIDAVVKVPDQTAVPIYSVVPMEVSEESLKNYTESLFGAGKFHNRVYSRHLCMTTRTEEEIYELIETYTRWLDSPTITDTPEPVFDENDNIIEMNEEDKQMYQDSVEALKDELLRRKEAAYGEPITYEFTPQRETVYLMDGETVEYEYESATYTGEYNGKEYDLSVFKDGRNTEVDFELRKGTILKNGYDINLIGWQADYERYNGSIAEKTNSCQYSQEEAVNLCREFLAGLGIENMDVGYVDDLHLLTWKSGNETYLGNKGYYLYFYWENENMGDSYAAQEDSYLALWTAQDTTLLPFQAARGALDDVEEGYQLEMYRGIAVFTVLDDGIVRAWISNPVENRELQAENVKLLDFDQVLKQGMACMETLYGDSGTSDPGGYQNIVIRSIELHYARMQSPDNENEFTMIPVWDFMEFEDGRIMLSINAIDGSRFDRESGY